VVRPRVLVDRRARFETQQRDEDVVLANQHLSLHAHAALEGERLPFRPRERVDVDAHRAASCAWTGWGHSPVPSSAGSSSSTTPKVSANAWAATGRTASTVTARPSSWETVVNAASSSPQAVIQLVNGAGSRSTFSA